MFTQYHYANEICGKKLDFFLAKGWFRCGQGINTASVINFEGNLYSPVRIRLPLKDYHFRKSLRKIINKNKAFSIEVNKATFTAAKEQLYQQFRKKYYLQVPISLKRYLQDDFENSVFDTMEMAVYDQHQLIAVSFFDVGVNSIASILGVYDELYASCSLGFYTMLAEIDFAQKNNYDYYYPGYVVPGFPKFDYKLRIGAVDYYEPSQDCWLPFEQMEPACLPAFVINKKLNVLAKLLKKHQLSHQLMYYPFLDKGFINRIGVHTELSSPLFIKLTIPGPNKNLAIEYDYNQSTYQLSTFIGFDKLIEANPFYLSHSLYPTFEGCLIKMKTLFESKRAKKVLGYLKKCEGLIKKVE